MKLLRRGVSESLNYSGLFQSWEIAIAKNLIEEHRSRYPCIEREDFNDLLQICLTHWDRRKKGYDPARGASRETFMGKVIRNKLTDLVRKRESNKRKVDYIAVSLDEPLADEEDSSTLGDTIDESTVKGGSPDPFFRVDLRIDLSRVLKKFTPHQKKLCHLLGEKGLTVTEASDYLKTPRSTIYDELKRIGELFQREGLRDYLK